MLMLFPCGPSVILPRLVAWKLTIVAGSLLVFSLACEVIGQGVGAERTPMSTLTLTHDDNGKAVTIHVGERIVVRLGENPTTGYRWAIEKDNEAEAIVALESSVYARSRESGVGGGGQRILNFTMRKVGTSTLRMKHWRAWEGDASIVEHFTVTVDVRE